MCMHVDPIPHNEQRTSTSSNILAPGNSSDCVCL